MRACYADAILSRSSPAPVLALLAWLVLGSDKSDAPSEEPGANAGPHFRRAKSTSGRRQRVRRRSPGSDAPESLALSVSRIPEVGGWRGGGNSCGSGRTDGPRS
jgi:hypothetical protein